MHAAKQTPTDASHITQYSPGNIYTKLFDWLNRLDVPANYKLVLSFLIRMCGHDGQNSCGRKFIAERLGISERTVSRAVLYWERHQFVMVVRRYQRARKTNVYRLHPDILKSSWAGGTGLSSGILPKNKSDKEPHRKNRHEHGTCMDPSSAHAHVREETLSASRSADGNEPSEEHKTLIREIVEIRTQLHESNPERYSKIISPKAYTGKLATKSIQELRTELSQNRNVLENSKKPKPVAGSGSGQSIMAQANEIERTTFTGSHEPWFVAWSSLEEQDRIGWRERTEAQLWNDSGWDEWCRQHPDPVEQELARRRATRNLFKGEWEHLHGQDAATSDAAEVEAEPDTDPADSTPSTKPDHRAETVTVTGNQVTPTADNPDDNPPPTSPKPKRRRQQQREHRECRQTSMPPATNRTPSQPLENACAGVLAQGRSHSEPTTDLPTGNVLAFRRPTRTASTEQEPRGDPDG